jgi:hypothetical protein
MKTALIGTLLRGGQKALATEKGKQWTRLGISLLVFPLFVWALSKAAPAALAPDFIDLQLKIFLLFAATAALLITFPKLRPLLANAGSKIADQDRALETFQRLYLRVAAILLLLLFLAWLHPGPSLRPFLGVFAAFCVFVAVYDALRWYKAVSEHTLGKAALGLGFAAASTIAYALARQEIASVTHVVPLNFQHTTILMAILTIPFLLVVAGGALYAISMFASLLIVPISLLVRNMGPGMTHWLFAGVLKEGSIKYPLVTRVFQCLFYAVLGTTLYNLGKPAMSSYEAALQKLAPSAVFIFDMYEGRECPLSRGEKLAALGDAKFLIGRRDASGEIEFVGPVKCDDLAVRSSAP